MKKSISVLLASVLLVFALTACQNSEKSPAVETLGVIYEDGATITMDMDQEAVKKDIKDAPNETEERNVEISDMWISGRSFSVHFETETPNRVIRIFVLESEEQNVSTTLGVSKGDSVASMKEKLGELCSVTENSGESDYLYGFQYVEGRYEMVDVDAAFNELSDNLENARLYAVNFSCKDDKIVSIYISDVLADFR